MYKLGQKVCVVQDSLEQNLPIGKQAYIIAYERNADNIFDYVIRVPKVGKHFYVPASDVEAVEAVMQQVVDNIEREALIDFALATKNEQLFYNVLNGEQMEAESHHDKDASNMDAKEFIKQVNLRAWI
ncbi:ATPase [Longirhabdus pacifica]|uniref:ATPase n=1 Tax=Longirhabdus pacifica TaxID=2305227 RepID=UPI0010092CA0|nr:ATPase [Longirhabdus pacifica]